MAAKKKIIKETTKKTAPKKIIKKKVVRRSVSRKLDNLTDKLNSLKKKKYFPFLALILILITIVYFGRSLLFVAIVDGKPISRLKLISELEKSGGSQTLESLISKELISQEAKRKGINISDLEVNSEIDTIKKYLEDQGSSLDLYLSMQGQTMENLTENIKIQKTIEKIFSDKINVSEEEIVKYFEANKAYYGENANFDEIKNSIQDQISQEKLANEFQTLLQKLKDEGNIMYFVDFE